MREEYVTVGGRKYRIKGRCAGCEKPFTTRVSKTGYCADCFHADTDGIKTAYNAERWRSGTAYRSHLKNRGVTLTEAELQRHNDTTHCEICETLLVNDKVLDHCHETGTYRGTLCRQCNTSLGQLGDHIPTIIERLRRYAS